MKKFFIVSVLAGAIFFLSLSNVFAASDISGSLDYVKSFQQENGGLTEYPAKPAELLESSWGAIAFASAGFNPATVYKNQPTNNLLDYSLDKICANESVTDIERAVLVASASGLDAHNINGCDLVAKVQAFETPEGAIGPDVVSSIFGVLALRSAISTVDDKALDYLLENQKSNGGWDSGYGTEANVTAQAIQALAQAGVDSGDPHIQSAKNYLKSLQSENGGIKYDSMFWTTSTDAFSDAYTLQAIYALGEDPADFFWNSNGKTILDDLASLRSSDGSYSFSVDYGKMNPVWTTSIVLVALGGKSLAFRGEGLKAFAISEPTTTPSLTPTPIVSASTVVDLPVQMAVADVQNTNNSTSQKIVKNENTVQVSSSPSPSPVMTLAVQQRPVVSHGVKGAENRSKFKIEYLYYLGAVLVGLVISIFMQKYLAGKIK